MFGFFGMKWAMLLSTAMAFALVAAISLWLEHQDEMARADHCAFVDCTAPGGHVKADPPIRMPRP